MDKKNLELITELRHELHSHPELSNEEFWTKNKLMGFLKIHTNLQVVDKGSWFYAFYHAGDDKTSIAFRADFDAVPVQETGNPSYVSKIPGVGHMCGHDGHSSVLCGLALEVCQNGADQNVYFVFQHAEETADGAKVCAPLMKEKGIDEIYAFHNMPGQPLKSVAVIDGTSNCASKGMIIKLKGTPTHASLPEKGINPSFAVASIINEIPDMIAPEKHKGLILCTVIQVDIGERAFGVSASEGSLLLTIRAQYETEINALQDKLESLTRSEAEKYQLKYSFEYCDVFPETANHKESMNKVRQVCQKMNIQIVEMPEPIRGSEDYGYFLKETKGAIFYVGNGEDYPAAHTSNFDFPDEIMEPTVEIFKMLISYPKSI